MPAKRKRKSVSPPPEPKNEKERKKKKTRVDPEWGVDSSDGEEKSEALGTDEEKEAPKKSKRKAAAAGKAENALRSVDFLELLDHVSFPPGVESERPDSIDVAFNPDASGYGGTLISPEGATSGKKKLRFLDVSTSTVPAARSTAKRAAGGRIGRLKEQDAHGALLKHKDNYFVPCLGEVYILYHEVSHVAVDHMEDKRDLIDMVAENVNKLNSDKEFLAKALKKENAKKFFIEVGEGKKKSYYGTLYLYEIFFNNYGNLWLLCEACNKKKGTSVKQWFLKNRFFGERFIAEYETFQKGKPSSVASSSSSSSSSAAASASAAIILKKLAPGVDKKQGLAGFALNWFWEHHSQHLRHHQAFMKGVVFPMGELFNQADEVANAEPAEPKRSKKMQKEIKVKLGLQTGVAKAGASPPGSPSSDGSLPEDVEAKFIDEISEKIAAKAAKETRAELREKKKEYFSTHPKKSSK